MRKIADNPNETYAQALSALLDVNEIENEVRASNAGFTIWVRQDDDLPKAKLLLDSFEPDAAAELVNQAEKIRRARELERRPVATVRRVSTSRNVQIGLGVGALGVICIVVGVVYKLGWAPPLGFVPIDFRRGAPMVGFDWSQPWRLITPIFIHFGLFHLVFNLMWLRRFGGQIEENHGTMRLLLLVLVSAAVSNIAQYLTGGPYFGGISGVNYALFGFGWMNTRFGPKGAYAVTQSDAGWMMIWLVLCATGMMGPVANGAHAGGLICGTALGIPAYIRFRTTFKLKTQFEKGSWEDLHVQGWPRFRRLYFEPYLPAWVLLIAFCVLLADHL